MSLTMVEEFNAGFQSCCRNGQVFRLHDITLKREMY